MYIVLNDRNYYRHIDKYICWTYVDHTRPPSKTKTKKPLFYLDNIFNNLLIFGTDL